MKRISLLTTSIALASLIGSGAFAGEVAKTTIKPVTVVKSTQAPVSLGLGGLGAGGAAAVVIGGIVAVAAIASITSSTSGT